MLQGSITKLTIIIKSMYRLSTFQDANYLPIFDDYCIIPCTLLSTSAVTFKNTNGIRCFHRVLQNRDMPPKMITMFRGAAGLPCVNSSIRVRTIQTLDSESLSIASIVEMKRFLRSKDIGFEDGYACLRIDCPVCRTNRRRTKSLGKMFINKTTGFFLCLNCQVEGSWTTLQRIVTLLATGNRIPKDELIQMTTTVPTNVIELMESSTPVAQLPDETLLKFNIASTTLKLYDARCEGDRLIFPLYGGDGSVRGCKSIKQGEATVETFPPDSPLLFGWRRNISCCIIVPSLIHALHLGPHSSVSTLSLPTGHLPQTSLPYLEQMTSLTLWMGDSIHDTERAKSLGRKMGEKRCHVVRRSLPTKEQELSSSEIGKLLSESVPLGHKAITTFASLREDVRTELEQKEQVNGVRWVRFPPLNRLLGGHRRGELTVFTGPTGSGKTTFISEYSLDLCMQGVTTLWGSFELPTVRLAKTMLQQFSGKPLDEHLDEYDQWADKLEKLPLYFLTFHGEQSIKAVSEAMSHAVYLYDVSHVIVDNLQFMMGDEASRTNFDRFWKQDLIVGAFRKFATIKNCHVTLVIHPRKEREGDSLSTSSIFGGARASQEADNVLILQDRRMDTVRGRKFIQVTKNRYSGDLGIMPLEFDREALSFAPKKKMLKRSKDSIAPSSTSDLPSSQKKKVDDDIL